MAAIFLPSRRKRRPVGEVGIDWGHPRSQSLQFSWTGHRYLGPVPGLANSRLTVGGGTPAFGGTPQGPAIALSSSAYLTMSGSLLASRTTPAAISWLELPGTVPSYAAMLAVYAGFTTTFAILRGSSADDYGLLSLGTGDGNGVSFNGSGIPQQTAGTMRRLLLVCSAGAGSNSFGSYSCWVDGVSYTATKLTAFGTTGTSNYIGWDSSDTKYVGTIADVLIWSRVPSTAEIIEYFEDPYSHYLPINRRIWSVVPPVVVTVNVMARAGRLRTATAYAPTKATAVVARPVRIRAAEASTSTRSAAVVARTRQWSRDTVAATRVLTVSTRAGRLRTAAPFTVLHIVNIVARAGRLRSAVVLIPRRAVAVAMRAGLLRTANLAEPPLTNDPRFIVAESRRNFNVGQQRRNFTADRS